MPIVRIPRFVISKKPYAIQPSTFEAVELPDGAYVLQDGKSVWRTQVRAVWFRRKSGVLGAHVGHLWETLRSKDAPTLETMKESLSTARYGGTPLARWDGSSLWTQNTLPHAENVALIEELDPVLKGFPNIPEGHDGWFILTEN